MIEDDIKKQDTNNRQTVAADFPGALVYMCDGSYVEKKITEAVIWEAVQLMLHVLVTLHGIWSVQPH